MTCLRRMSSTGQRRHLNLGLLNLSPCFCNWIAEPSFFTESFVSDTAHNLVLHTICRFPVGFIPEFVVLSEVTNKVTALTCICRKWELLLLNCLEAASLSNMLLLPKLSAQHAYSPSSSLTEPLLFGLVICFTPVLASPVSPGRAWPCDWVWGQNWLACPLLSLLFAFLSWNTNTMAGGVAIVLWPWGQMAQAKGGETGRWEPGLWCYMWIIPAVDYSPISFLSMKIKVVFI